MCPNWIVLDKHMKLMVKLIYWKNRQKQCIYNPKRKVNRLIRKIKLLRRGKNK